MAAEPAGVHLPAPRSDVPPITIPDGLQRRLTLAQLTTVVHFHEDHLFHVETAVRNGMAIADAHAHSIQKFVEQIEHHQVVRPAPGHHVHKLSTFQGRAITRFQISYLHNLEEALTAKSSFEEAHVFAVHKAHDRAQRESRESESVEA